SDRTDILDIMADVSVHMDGDGHAIAADALMTELGFIRGGSAGAVSGGAPPTLAFVSKTPTSISVTATRRHTATAYQFYDAGVKSTTPPDADGNYTYTGLTPGTAHTLNATAVNASGLESGFSNTVSQSTSSGSSANVAVNAVGTGVKAAANNAASAIT